MPQILTTNAVILCPHGQRGHEPSNQPEMVGQWRDRAARKRHRHAGLSVPDLAVPGVSTAIDGAEHEPD